MKVSGFGLIVKQHALHYMFICLYVYYALVHAPVQTLKLDAPFCFLLSAKTTKPKPIPTYRAKDGPQINFQINLSIIFKFLKVTLMVLLVYQDENFT